MTIEIEDLGVLTKEIESYNSSARHAECIRRMEEYEKRTTNPEVKAVILLAMASAALNLNDLTIADRALSRIEVELVSAALRNYVDLTSVTAARMAGRLLEADAIVSTILARKQTQDQEHRAMLQEALAQKGFIQADLSHYRVALELLTMASALPCTMPTSKDLLENVSLYKAYCLQALSRLDEAENCLTAILGSSGKFQADAHYRMGAIKLQKQEFAAARVEFIRASRSQYAGRITPEAIQLALREVEGELEKIKTFDD